MEDKAPSIILTNKAIYEYVPRQSHIGELPKSFYGSYANVYLYKSNNLSYAVKIFRESSLQRSYKYFCAIAEVISQLKNVRGYEAANQYIITPELETELTKVYPQLIGGIISPWVNSSPLHQYYVSSDRVNAEDALRLVYELAVIVAQLEMLGLAHCDLSSRNVLFSHEEKKFHIIDFDTIYSPQITSRPLEIETGTPGYTKFQSGFTAFSAYSDRFSLAILIIEVLIKSLADVSGIFSKDKAGLFSNNDIKQGTRSLLYKFVAAHLKEKGLSAIIEFFETAWSSQSLDQCPSASDWAGELKQLV